MASKKQDLFKYKINCKGIDDYSLQLEINTTEALTREGLVKIITDESITPIFNRLNTYYNPEVNFKEVEDHRNMIMSAANSYIDVTNYSFKRLLSNGFYYRLLVYVLECTYLEENYFVEECSMHNSCYNVTFTITLTKDTVFIGNNNE